MTSKITNTNFVFCPPQLGKPDPKEPRPSSGPDTRKRVLQQGLKYNTCWYRVFNDMRPRFKAPNTEALPERQFEKLASARRKALTQHEKSLPDLCDQLNADVVHKFLTPLTKQSVKEKNPLAVLVLQQLSIPEAQIEQFLTQNVCNNFFDYLVYLKYGKRCEIDETFLKTVSLDPKALFEQFQKTDTDAWKHAYASKSWEKLMAREKSSLLEQFVRTVSAKKYGLGVSAWKPSDSFDSFVSQLKTDGPMAVAGLFGRVYYKVDASEMQKQIAGRKVFYWKKSDPVNGGKIMGHMILLVGAEKCDGRNLVYFIDPYDDSDPAHPEKQRIYTISYERLTSPENLSDNVNLMRPNAPPSVGYGWQAASLKEKDDQKKQ